MPVFMVTIVYRHTDGRTLRAWIAAETPDAQTAVEAAIQAMAGRPHCAEVLGGMCEELGEEEKLAETTETRPVGATVH